MFSGNNRKLTATLTDVARIKGINIVCRRLGLQQRVQIWKIPDLMLLFLSKLLEDIGLYDNYIFIFVIL